MDKVFKDLGRGIDDFINGLIYKLGDKVDGMIAKAGEVGGSMVAGVSSVIEGISDRASSISFERSAAPAVEVAEKKGRSADLHMGRLPEENLGRDGVSMTEIGDLKLQNVGKEAREAVQGLNF